MSEPKIEQYKGRDIHQSAGALIVQDGQILLMDRKKPPFGLAGPAGHVDTGETPDQAVVRELEEETGLTVTNKHLLIEEFVSWNTCSYGIEGHHWFLYYCEVAGEPRRDDKEAKTLDWHALASLDMTKLEPVWSYWLEKPEVKKELV